MIGRLCTRAQKTGMELSGLVILDVSNVPRDFVLWMPRRPDIKYKIKIISVYEESVAGALSGKWMAEMERTTKKWNEDLLTAKPQHGRN